MLRGVAAKGKFDVAIPINSRVMLWKFPLIAAQLNPEYMPQHVFRERDFSFTSSVFDQPDDTTFKGYFQSEKYFKHIELELRKTFAFSKAEIGEVNALNCVRNGRPLISLHVRRRDYCNNPAHADLYGNYYPNAMSLFPDAMFIVFSDDLEWCRQKFKGDRVKFFHGSSMYVDMAGMAYCDHHIISNSTFSWWGAWLNPSSCKRVVRPSVWWGPKTAHLKDHDICPASWEAAPI